MTEKKTGWLRNLIPGYTVPPLICALALQILVYTGTKLLMLGAHHRNFESALDLAIPFLPWTVCIYAGAFLYWAVAFVAILRGGRDNAFRFLCAHMVSLLAALAFFLLLPTTNTRPAVEPHGFWNRCMRLVYAVDTPDNLLPSLHCELSWLCWRSLGQVPKVSRRWKAFCLVFTLMIFVSTLTTKQHILIDVAAGWLLGELAYRACGSRKFTKPFYQVFDRPR